MSTKRIAIIVGAGWSTAAGWPDTIALLAEGAWLVTAAQAARYRRVWTAYATWRATNPNPSGDAFMAAVDNGRVRGIDWPSIVEVIAGTLASVGATISPFVSPRYADSPIRPNLWLNPDPPKLTA